METTFTSYSVKTSTSNKPLTMINKINEKDFIREHHDVTTLPKIYK